MSGEIVQATFDYSLVTDEQASQLQGIYNRVLTRHVTTAYEDGKDLLEAKNIKNLPYKEFVAWAWACYGWSEAVVDRKINRTLYWGDFTLVNEGKIDALAIEALSTKRVPESARQEAKKLLASGVDIDEEKAKEIRDAHQAREEAEKKAKDAQHQLNLFTQLSHEKMDSLSQQILDLEEKLKKATTPEKVEVIPQETQDKITNLEELTRKQKERIDILSKHSENLADELLKQTDANEERRKREQYEAGIRNEWKKATDVLCKAMTTFIGQIPPPIDIQVFEAREWAKYDQTEQALINCQEALARAKITRYGDLFVESQPYHQELTVYGQAEAVDAL